MEGEGGGGRVRRWWKGQGEVEGGGKVRGVVEGEGGGGG